LPLKAQRQHWGGVRFSAAKRRKDVESLKFLPDRQVNFDASGKKIPVRPHSNWLIFGLTTEQPFYQKDFCKYNSQMGVKIALVHDYLKEYGGAERVLSVLHEMYPEAPIYTAFKAPGSTADKAFRGAKIITSWADLLIRYKNLHSLLRFLVPLIWESFDFSGFDVVILSSSGYLTKPIRIPKQVKVICYCHTPPRFLYGYPGMDYRKYWYARLYKNVVAHFLRLYDWQGAQRVDQFVANSAEVAKRIKKFYRRDAIVIYPPVTR